MKWASLSKRFRDEIGSKLEIGVGLNTAMVVAGFVGVQGHRNDTVMGDAVNLASRLEASINQVRRRSFGYFT
jgi:class 3 adenylate cyclase